MPDTLLGKILAPGAISTVFQPIYKAVATGFSPVILECLSRGPAGTNAESPAILFEYAQLKAAEPLVDRACISAALTAIAELKPATKISLNVFAATLARDNSFVDWAALQMKRLDLNPCNIIFEIVEHGEAWDTKAFLDSLSKIRAVGSMVALDDVGLAHSNFQRILESNAEYLKIDRCVVHECHLDKRRQALLKCLASLAKDLGAELIAEGVESDAALHAIRSQAIDLFQGFLFSRPVSASEISALLTTVFTGSLLLPASNKKPPKQSSTDFRSRTARAF
jgi:EAL domain-containing protein (putative c-di-GMP-specific phosphodiesterase class I)